MSPSEATSFYESMSREELINANVRLREAKEKKKQALDRIYQIIRLPNDKMSPGEKLALIAADAYVIPKEKKNEQGLIRMPINMIAKETGMSEQSAGRHIGALVDRFGATKVNLKYRTIKGRDCDLAYVNPDEMLWTDPCNVEIPEDQKRVINGNGDCPHCHNTNTMRVIKKRITYREVRICDCCHYQEVSEIKEDEENKHLKAGIKLPEKETQAEDHFPPQAEEENATQAEDTFPLQAEEEKSSQAEDHFPPQAEEENATQAEDTFPLQAEEEKSSQAEDHFPLQAEEENVKRFEIFPLQAEEEKETQAEDTFPLQNSWPYDPSTPPPPRSGVSAFSQKGSQPEEPFSLAPDFFAKWLLKRIGANPRLSHMTGKAEQGSKYISNPVGDTALISLYVNGHKDHIYASRPALADGTTWLLGFDLDQKDELDQYHQEWMKQLARAGASVAYWNRRQGSGHLEIYFDQPVDRRAAYAWACDVCPGLASVKEVFPIGTDQNKAEGASSRSDFNYSWPLWYREGNTVWQCSAEFAFSGNPEMILTSEGIDTDRHDLGIMLMGCVTQAALIPPLPAEPVQQVERSSASVGGGGYLDKPLSADDVAKRVIAEFNSDTPWEELLGQSYGGKYLASWRGDRIPNVAIDPKTDLAKDFSSSAWLPHVMDKYQVHCFIEGKANWKQFKKIDVAARCAKWRAAKVAPTVPIANNLQEKQEASPAPPTLFSSDQTSQKAEESSMLFTINGSPTRSGIRCTRCTSQLETLLHGKQRCSNPSCESRKEVAA